jgi:hypothetical protein
MLALVARPSNSSPVRAAALLIWSSAFCSAKDMVEVFSAFCCGVGPMICGFLQDGAGKATSLVLNPGPWQIAGQRIN